jgi:adenine-specific DNA methylase
MTIESHYDIRFVAELALREKQIQQNYRPIIAVHKWFARRPGTLFRSLILSEFADGPVEDAFYKSHSFQGRTVADPFMGGGIPLLEANRLGCDVVGVDINPMSAWVVGEEIKNLDIASYEAVANSLIERLAEAVGDLYSTRCTLTGATATGKYFLWVKQGRCDGCSKEFDLFQGYLLADDTRHTANVIVCSCRLCRSGIFPRLSR